MKNRWKFLKHFNYKVDRASPIIDVCRVFHNYCEMWGASELGLANEKKRGDTIMGFGVDRLPNVREGKHAKT